MSIAFKAIIFVAVSAGLVWLSWSSLCDNRSHGFYRFFAFEAIVILILLNLEYWFYNPFSVQQIVSWLLLIISLVLVIHGFHLLHSVGKPDNTRKDSALIEIEKTTELITVGVYRYIRHPIYSSALFGAWGVLFKHLSWLGLILAVIATIFITITAMKEEAENICFFGDPYRDYMKKTKRLVPFVF